MQKKKKIDNKYDASIAFYFLDFKTCSCNLKFVVRSLQLQKEVSNSKFEVVHVFNLTKSRYMFHVHCILYTQNLKMDYTWSMFYLFIYHLTIAPNNVKSCTSSSRALNSSHENLE
jgi:hypothetical protein